jgi:hypothetical protein
MTRIAPVPMEKTKAKMAVRSVEGRVRSFVHSPLRILLMVATRTGSAGVAG